MIEMLGVLAIIGVLAVGGIAGYSKAMMKFKVNKAVSEYNYLVQGLLEHLDNINHLSTTKDVNIGVSFTNFIFAQNLVPNTWTYVPNTTIIYDPYGNYINAFSRNEHMVINIYFGKWNTPSSSDFSHQFFFDIIQTVIKPLSPILRYIWVSNGNTIYGDSECLKTNYCLRTLSLSDIKRISDYCTNKNDIPCYISLQF